MLQIELISKNSKSVYKLLNFFKSLTKKTIKTIIFNKKIQKQKKLVNTLLKSPHVHKIAQEKFEYRLYKRKIILTLTNPGLFLILLKKVLNFGFFDLKILINYYLFKIFFKEITRFFNVNNFYFLYFHFFYNNSYFIINFLYKKRFKTYNFLNLLRIKGIVLLQNYKLN